MKGGQKRGRKREEMGEIRYGRGWREFRRKRGRKRGGGRQGEIYGRRECVGNVMRQLTPHRQRNASRVAALGIYKIAL